MRRFNTIMIRIVPRFLVLLLALTALGSCGQREGADQVVNLDEEERFFVEQYLRIVEARLLAAERDSTAEGYFHFLENDLPADSMRAIAQRIAADDPGRWPLLFEEIVRRKKVLEEERR